MPRYYMHLRHCCGDVIDDDGVEIATIEEVHAKATTAAREIMASDVTKGVLDLTFSIDVADEQGLFLFSQSFDTSIVIRRPR